jgi:glycosyltransferase involved in cell wall biosynthesis
MGRPVVTGDTAAVRAALDGAVVTVPPGDPEALAAAIRALRDDPEARGALARAGHARYRARYDELALSAVLDRELGAVIRH